VTIVTDAEENVYVGRAPCGCIRAVIVDADDARWLTAITAARWLRSGLTIERMAVETVRTTSLTRPDCQTHRQPERQGGLL